MTSGAQRKSRKAQAIARAAEVSAMPKEKEVAPPKEEQVYAAPWARGESDGAETASTSASSTSSQVGSPVPPTLAPAVEKAHKAEARATPGPSAMLSSILQLGPPHAPPSSPWLGPHFDPLSLPKLSTDNWYEKGVEIEDVAPPKEEEVVTTPQGTRVTKVCPHLGKPEVINDVKPHLPETRENPRIAALLEQARVLSEDCFLANCLEGCSKRGGWRITLLASPAAGGADDVLLGFIVWRIKATHNCLSVSKLAVPEAFRGHGYGRQLILWAVKFGKTQPGLECVALSSLPKAISFYQRLGFKKLEEITPESLDQDDPCGSFFPGQWYMEHRMPRKGGKRR